MKRLARELEQARDQRDEARDAFQSGLRMVGGDIETRGIGGRIADRLGNEARDTFEDAMDVARESKGVIAGTAAALALWFLRQPIIGWIETRLGDRQEQDMETEHDG